MALAIALSGTAVLQGASLTFHNTDAARFGSVNLSIDGSNKTVNAGVLDISVDGGAIFDAFCVDLFTSISTGTYTTSAVAPRASRYEDRAAWLYQNYYTAASINTPTLGAAFQVTIWDIVHDGGDGPNAGRVRSQSGTPAAVVSNWTNWLLLSQGKSSNTVNIFLNSKLNKSYQTLMGGHRNPPPTETPEPSTWALMGVGLFLLSRRKRGSKVSS